MSRSIRRRHLVSDERGLSTVEYIIILALVAIIGFVVWQMLGQHAAERNRGASGVVNGLATHSTEDETGSGGRSGRGGAGGSVHEVDGRGGGSSLHDIAPPAAEEEGGGSMWRWGLLGAVVFGGMMYWLARNKN